MRSFSLLTLCTGAFLFLCSFTSRAQQSIEVSGQVKDSETREVLPFCKVVALNNAGEITQGGFTDDKGFFKLPLSPGEYSLVVSFYGYSNDTIATGLLREDAFVGVVKLKQDVVNLDAVEAQASSKIDMLDREVKIITDKEKQGATAAKDVLDRVAGVSYDDYSGVLKVDNDANIMILVNGVEKNQEYIQNLEPERLLRVEITRDPGGRYGLEGYTAILNVILKDDYKGTELYIEQMQLVDITQEPKLDLLILGIGATYNYTANKLNLYASAGVERKRFKLNTTTRTEYDDNIVVLEKQLTDRPNTRILEYGANYTLGFDYRLNPKHTISFESNIMALPLGTEDNEFEYSTEVYADNILIDTYDFQIETKTEVLNTHNTLFYIGEFNKKNRMNVNFTYSNYRGDYTTNSLQEVIYDRSETGINKKQYTRFYAEFEHLFSSKASLQVGYGNTWRELDNNYTILQTDLSSGDAFSISDNFRLTDMRHKLYGYFSWKLNTKWGLRAGIASENSSPRAGNQQLNYMIYQPMFDLRYAPGKNINFKLKYRTTSGYPTIAQTNPFVSQINPRMTSTGNPFLRPSTNHQFSIRMNVLQGIFALEPYYQYSNNTVVQVGEIDSEGMFNYRYENAELSERLGARMNFSHYFKFSLLVQGNLDFYQSRIVSTTRTNTIRDWRADVDLIYIFPKTQTLLGVKYQRQQSKYITGLGYEKGEVDFWMLFYKQPLFKKRASIMFGYFLPIDVGANFNQDSRVETTGFTMQTDNDVSLVKNMFILELSYRFGKGKSVKKTEKNVDRETEDSGGGLF